MSDTELTLDIELTLDFVKKHLHVDFDEDDSLITLIIFGAKEYIQNAVGKYDKNSALHIILALALISEMYEKRTLTAEKVSEKSYIIKSIVDQLQLKADEGDDYE